ncbi:MAG: ATP-binding cassette domain-containing protein [Propionibacteriaceae bacterium]|nr:ATP-binding cassette domain-containing protein [Propionibacteriaceae bacterium]
MSDVFSPRLLGRDLTVRFSATTPLNGINFDFSAEDYPVAVTGPSGSGKTTLLRVIAGVLPADAGDVLIDGQPVGRPSWRSSGDARIGLIHQDYRLVPFLTVGENLRLAWETRRPGSPSDDDVLQALAQVGLDGISPDRMPETLSGGEQQRVAIARTLLAGCTVLLADEPTGALDAENTGHVAELLTQLAREHGVAVVVATHDLGVAAKAVRRFRMGEGALCPST